MRLAGAIAGVYAALILLTPAASLAQETENSPGKPPASFESVDSALQRLYASQSVQSQINAADNVEENAEQPETDKGAAAPENTRKTGAVQVNTSAIIPAVPTTPVDVTVAPQLASAPDSQPAQTAASMPLLWVYEFSAPWCPSCRQLSPLLEEAAGKYSGFVQYVPVNVDANREVLKRLQIDLIPTVMVIDRNGRLLNRLVGLQQGVQIGEILQHYKTEATATLGGPY
jgi:thioredoxin 1